MSILKSLMPSLLVRDEPNNDLFLDLQSDIDRVFRQYRYFMPSTMGQSSAAETGFLTPKINLSESEKSVEVEVELPGIDKDNIEVSVEAGNLVIQGQQKEEKESKEKNYHIKERRKGGFKRVIPLGFDVEEEGVDARFRDGVLHLAIKKPETVTQSIRKIPIQAAEST